MLTFNDDIFQELELYARNAVLDAGIASMRYYREAFRRANALGNGFNASTEADIQATLAALRSLGSVLHHLDDQYHVYGEELDVEYSKAAVRKRMDEEIPQLNNANNVVRSGNDFILGFPKHLSVLIDGIDGTTNFRAGLPIFCSALAIFIDSHLRVGAVYDPHHHVVYYGSLPDKKEPRANIWYVSSGENVRMSPPTDEGELLVATHFTRGKDDESTAKRSKMINSMVNVVPHCGGHYQLNSGQLALTHVAAGILSGFANNHTNAWDVAAGQILIEAVGGKVRHFDGSRIDYTESGKVEVLAAGTAAIYDRLKKMLS